jgi:hypothetical protein
MYDPTLFDSPMLETANEAVLFCKELLEKRDITAAAALESLGPISNKRLARMALEQLKHSRTRSSADSREYFDWAVDALTRALRPQQLAAVA